MTVFHKNNGQIVIMHDHSFSILECKHYYKLYVIYPDDREDFESDLQSRKEGKEWENLIKFLEE